METSAYLSAEEAAAALGIGVSTLYAYVSRGVIRSDPLPGTRKRGYRAADVTALIAGRGRDAGPDRDAGTVLDSAITRLSDDGPAYRGRAALELAETLSLESVARLMWQTQTADPFDAPAPGAGEGAAPVIAASGGLPPLARARAWLAALGPEDWGALNQTATGQAATGARLLRWMAAALLGTGPSTSPAHSQLAAAWDLDADGADTLRRALVVLADHELNASTYAVRVVTGTGADFYAAVGAGLAALGGPRHGGLTARVAALLPDLLAAGDARGAVAERLRRGDGLPGFGHPLYPKGDPRARALMGHLRTTRPDDPAVDRAHRLALAGEDMAGKPPTVDFALALIAHVFALPADAPMTLFALGRTVGWLAHAMEQAASGQMIRPRARYVGVVD